MCVHAIHSLSPNDELLINYKFRRTLTTHKKFLPLGLPLGLTLGSTENIIDLTFLYFFNGNNLNVLLNLTLFYEVVGSMLIIGKKLSMILINVWYNI